MKRMAFLCLIALLGAGATGCSHYQSSLSRNRGANCQLPADIAVAGILDRRHDPQAAVPATLLLLQQTKATDVSGKLSLDELSLLLSQPIELAVAKPRLLELKQRVGYRYVLVGEQGSNPLTEHFIWNSAMVIVIPPALVEVFFIPVTVSHKPNIIHATHILRLIDLEQAEIIGEDYHLLRDRDDEGEFTEKQICQGLVNIKLAKE